MPSLLEKSNYFRQINCREKKVNSRSSTTTSTVATSSFCSFLPATTEASLPSTSQSVDSITATTTTTSLHLASAPAKVSPTSILESHLIKRQRSCSRLWPRFSTGRSMIALPCNQPPSPMLKFCCSGGRINFRAPLSPNGCLETGAGGAGRHDGEFITTSATADTHCLKRSVSPLRLFGGNQKEKRSSLDALDPPLSIGGHLDKSFAENDTTDDLDFLSPVYSSFLLEYVNGQIDNRHKEDNDDVKNLVHHRQQNRDEELLLLYSPPPLSSLCHNHRHCSSNLCLNLLMAEKPSLIEVDSAASKTNINNDEGSQQHQHRHHQLSQLFFSRLPSLPLWSLFPSSSTSFLSSSSSSPSFSPLLSEAFLASSAVSSTLSSHSSAGSSKQKRFSSSSQFCFLFSNSICRSIFFYWLLFLLFLLSSASFHPSNSRFAVSAASLSASASVRDSLPFGLLNDNPSDFLSTKDNNVGQKRRKKESGRKPLKKTKNDFYFLHNRLLDDVRTLMSNSATFHQLKSRPQQYQLNYQWTCFQSQNNNDNSNGKSGSPLFFLFVSPVSEPPIAAFKTQPRYFCRLLSSLTSNYTTTAVSADVRETALKSTANQIGVKSQREDESLQLTNTPKRLKKLPLQLSSATNTTKTAAPLLVKEKQKKETGGKADKHHLFLSEEEEETGGKLQAAAFDITTTTKGHRKGRKRPFDIKMDLDDLQQQSQSQSSGINDGINQKEGEGERQLPQNLAAASTTTTTTTLTTASVSPSGPENGPNFKTAAGEAGASKRTSDAAAAFSVVEDADDERQRRDDATNDGAKKIKSKDHFYYVFSLLARGRNNDDDGDRHSFLLLQLADNDKSSRPPKSDSLLPHSSLPVLVIYVNDELPPPPSSPLLADVSAVLAVSNRCRQLHRQTNDDAQPAFCLVLLENRQPPTTPEKKNGGTQTTAVSGECTQNQCKKGQTGEGKKRGEGKNEKILQRLSEKKEKKNEQKTRRFFSCHCVTVNSERWAKRGPLNKSALEGLWKGLEPDHDDYDDQYECYGQNSENNNNINKGSTAEMCFCSLNASIINGISSGRPCRLYEEAKKAKREKEEERRRSTETNADSDLSSSTTSPSSSASTEVQAYERLKTTDDSQKERAPAKEETAADAAADDARRSSPSDAGHNSSIPDDDDDDGGRAVESGATGRTRNQYETSETSVGGGGSGGWPQSLNPETGKGSRIQATSASVTSRTGAIQDAAAAPSTAASFLTGRQRQLKRIHDNDSQNGERNENLPANSNAAAELLQPPTTASTATMYPADRTDRNRRMSGERNTKAVRQSFEANERKVKLNHHYNQKNKGINKNDHREMTAAAMTTTTTKGGRSEEEKENGSPSTTDLTTTTDQHLKASEAASAALEQFQPGNWRSSGRSNGSGSGQKWPLRRAAEANNNHGSSKLPIEAIEIDGSKDSISGISSRQSLLEEMNKSINNNSKDDNKSSAFFFSDSSDVNELQQERQKTLRNAISVPLSAEKEEERRGRSRSIRVKRSDDDAKETLKSQRAAGASIIQQRQTTARFSKEREDISKEGQQTSLNEARVLLPTEKIGSRILKTTTFATTSSDQTGSHHHFLPLLNSTTTSPQPTFHQHYSTNLVASVNRLPGDILQQKQPTRTTDSAISSLLEQPTEALVATVFMPANSENASTVSSTTTTTSLRPTPTEAAAKAGSQKSDDSSVNKLLQPPQNRSLSLENLRLQSAKTTTSSDAAAVKAENDATAKLLNFSAVLSTSSIFPSGNSGSVGNDQQSGTTTTTKSNRSQAKLEFAVPKEGGNLHVKPQQQQQSDAEAADMRIINDHLNADADVAVPATMSTKSSSYPAAITNRNNVAKAENQSQSSERGVGGGVGENGNRRRTTTEKNSTAESKKIGSGDVPAQLHLKEINSNLSQKTDESDSRKIARASKLSSELQHSFSTPSSGEDNRRIRNSAQFVAVLSTSHFANNSRIQQQQEPNSTTAVANSSVPLATTAKSGSETTELTSSKTWIPDAKTKLSIVNNRQSPADATGKLNEKAVIGDLNLASTSTTATKSSFTTSNSSFLEEDSNSDTNLDNHHCPAGPDSSSSVAGRHQLTWARTDAGVLALLPCQPSSRFTGTVYRSCYSSATWGPTDLSDCRLVALSELNRLVQQHVQKHLLEGLVPLTGQLARLLLAPGQPPLSSPLDRLDGLAALQHIFAHSKVQVRIEADAEEERRTIAFVQALVLISEHLLIDTKSVQFPAEAQKQTNQLQETIVWTMDAFRGAMENLLRALILSMQEGSLKTLLLQPTPLLPTSLKHFEITLSHRASGSSSLKPLVSSKTPQLFSKPVEKPKLSINLQNFTHIGVGVVEIWLRDVGTSLDRGHWCLVSDLLAVSILPAVSIEVDFEVAPKFEVLLPLHADHDALLLDEGDIDEVVEDVEIVPENSEFAQNESKKQSTRKGNKNSEDTIETVIPTTTVLPTEDGSATTTILNNEQSELKEDFGWSSNAANVPSSMMTRQRKLTRQKVKIGCGRLMANITVSPSSSSEHQEQKRRPANIWTTEGCQTAILSVHYLKCICNVPGVIGAVTVPVLTPPETAVGEEQLELEEEEMNLEIGHNPTEDMDESILGQPPPSTVFGLSNSGQLDSGKISTSSLNNPPLNPTNVMSTSMTTKGFSTSNIFFNNNNVHVRRHLLYGGRFRSRNLSAYDISLYISLALSILFLVTTLVVQFRFRKYETRETFFIVRNLLLSLLLIQLTFLLGTTFHMDLFWVKVARWTSSTSSSTLSSSSSSVAEMISSSSASSTTTNTFFTFARLQHSLCLSVPVFLHFIHLAVLFWMLSHTILLYQRFWRPLSTGSDDGDDHLLHSGNGGSINGCGRSMKIGSKTSKGNKCKTSATGVDVNSNNSQLSLTSKECRRRYLKKLRANKHFCSSSSSPDSLSSNGGKRSTCFYRLLKNSFTFVFYIPLQVLVSTIGGKQKHECESNNLTSNVCEESKNNHKLHHKHLILQKQKQQQQQCELPMENINQQTSEDTDHLRRQQPCGDEGDGNEDNGAYHLCEIHKMEQQKMQLNLPQKGPDVLLTVPASTAEEGQLKKSKRCCYCCGCFSSPPTSSIFCTWKCIHFIAFSMGLPFLLVLFSYLLNSKGYETRRYCWMSIEGGIQYSFIIPVLGLITTNTLLMLLVLKRYFERKPLLVKAATAANNAANQQQHQHQRQQQQHQHRYHLNSIRPSLRASIILLPFFSFNWFLSVLSLETLSTSPFELIFAFTNGLHAFLVFYYHCYQRYNIHVFLGVRYRRLHLKRRLAKLAYRLISVLNLNRWKWWRRWCDHRTSSTSNGNRKGRKNSSSSSSGTISRSSSFNWSSDFGGSIHEHPSSHHHHHHHQQHQYSISSLSGESISSDNQAATALGYPSKITFNDHQDYVHQHYVSSQPPLPPPPQSEYKCNSSGLYCNHCYCDNCGSQMTFDPETTTTKVTLDDHHHHHHLHQAQNHPLHTTFYCTCSAAVQPPLSAASSSTFDRTSISDQHHLFEAKGVQHQKMVLNQQQHHDHHHHHNYHHQQQQQQQHQYLQFANEDDDEDVVIVELDDDDDDEIIVGTDEDDGSEEESSDEVVDDDDDDADIEELAELANSLQLNEMYLNSRKDY